MRETHLERQRSTTLNVKEITGLIQSPRAALEDAEPFRDALGLPYVVVCNNQVGGLPRSIPDGYWSRLNKLDESTLGLVQTWKSQLERDPTGALLHLCHSNGALQADLALDEMPPELRKRIAVVTVAGQRSISRHKCLFSSNVGSTKDPIYKEAVKRRRISANIAEVDSEIKRDWDHSPRSEGIHLRTQEELSNAKAALDRILGV